MIVENIKISKQGRDQLVTLKRWTKIQHWNVLCRWALCTSLAEPTKPRELDIRADSNLEMTWKTFGGEYADLFTALLTERCKQDGLPLTPASLQNQFRLHLHRGIGYLAGDPNVKAISGLIRKALPIKRPLE